MMKVNRWIRVMLFISLAHFSLSFAGAEAGTIRGTITRDSDGGPIAGLNIQAHDFTTGQYSGSATTLPDGTYVISGLQTGSYRVGVNTSGTDYIGEYYNDVYLQHLANPVSVVAGETTSGVDFILSIGGSVRGSVTRETDGLPIEGMTVTAIADNGYSMGHAISQTDGSYTIRCFPQGSYRIVAYNFQSDYVQEYYNNAEDYHLAEMVSVATGQVIEGVDFVLSLGGSIQGRITRESDSLPIEGVSINAIDYLSTQGRGFAQSGQDGSYIIRALPARTYRVQAFPSQNSQGNELGVEYYDNVYDWNEAEAVSVAAGQATSGIDFSLSAGGSISGKVTRASDGQPIENLYVQAYDYSLEIGLGSAITQADGTYTIVGLPTGSFRVWVSTWETDYLTEYYNDTNNYGSAQPVSVTAGQTTPGIDFHLDTGGSISGTVRGQGDDQPISGLWVYAYDYETGNSGGSAITQPDGSYTLNGLPVGTYRIQVNTGGTDYIAQCYGAGGTGCSPVQVTAGQDVAGIDFSLSAGGSISGKVTRQSDGQAISGVQVNAWVGDDQTGWRQIGWATTQSDGSYVIGGLSSGSYMVDAASWNTDYVRTFYNNKANFTSADPVPVVAGQTTGAINFTVALGGSISGVVTRESDGQPILDAQVSVSDSVTGQQIGWGFTQSDGSYAIRGLPAGSYRVDASAWGTDYVREYYNNTSDRNSAEAVSVTAGHTTSGIDFSLALGGSISGVVTRESDGQPISGVYVNVLDSVTGAYTGYVTTQADGSYVIERLPSGSYKVQSASSGMYVTEYYNDKYSSSLADPVSVTAGQTTGNIDFQLESALDSDLDGMPDGWELKFFGNLDRNGNADYDSDGLSDRQEFNYRLDPANPDTDGDKISDGYEIQKNTDPLNPTSFPALPVKGNVTSVNMADGSYETFIELDLSSFYGALPDDLTSVSISGPGMNLTMEDLAYSPEARAFRARIPGQAPIGEYRFRAECGDLNGEASDYQTVVRSIPIPDASLFSPAAGQIVTSKTPVFTWKPVTFSDSHLFYRLEIRDSSETVVFKTNFFTTHYWPGEGFYTLPKGVLSPGQTYEWRIEAADHRDVSTIQNTACSEWVSFNMGATLNHGAVPAAITGGWGATTWSSSTSSIIVALIQVVDHDGVASDGSSHSVKVTSPNGKVYPLVFDTLHSPTFVSYSMGISEVIPGNYVFTVLDPDGNSSTISDTLVVNALNPPNPDSFTPSLKNPAVQSISASFDNVFVNGSLYDDFNSYTSIDQIDNSKWSYWSPALSIENQSLTAAVVSNTIESSSSTIYCSLPETIQSMKADITVHDASSEHNYAHMLANFFSNGKNDIISFISINGNKVSYDVMERSNDGLTRLWSFLQRGDLMTVSLGQTVTCEMAWDGHSIRFTADGNTAVFTPSGIIAQPQNQWRGLEARIDLETSTTPTFTWDPVEGATRYRARIYNNDATLKIWHIYTGKPSCIVPPGILTSNSYYRYRIEAWDGHSYHDVSNISLTPPYVSQSYLFYTDDINPVQPFIELEDMGAMSWNDQVNGAHLSFRIKVHDAQGVPGNIQSVDVKLPGGSKIPLTYDADKFFGETTGTSGVYYLRAVDLSPADGTYTFSVTDNDGNTYSVDEDLASNPIGYPDKSSLSASVQGNAIEIDWADVPEVLNDEGFYRLEIYDENLKQVYAFGAAESRYLLPIGLLKEGRPYRYRVTTWREYFEQNADNGSSSPASYDEMPVIMLDRALSDAIIALQVMTGLNPQGIQPNADVNGDDRIGLEEAVHALQKAAALR